MEINIRKKKNTLVFDLKGELDLYHAEEMRETLRKYIDSDEKKIILNLMELAYLDSSGLGALIWSLQYIRKKNGYICIAGLNGSPKIVLELSNAIRLFPVFKDEEEAMIMLPLN